MYKHGSNVKQKNQKWHSTCTLTHLIKIWQYTNGRFCFQMSIICSRMPHSHTYFKRSNFALWATNTVLIAWVYSIKWDSWTDDDKESLTTCIVCKWERVRWKSELIKEKHVHNLLWKQSFLANCTHFLCKVLPQTVKNACMIINTVKQYWAIISVFSRQRS